MGIFSSFLWILAGSAYAAGKGVQNTWHDAAFASTSNAPVVSDYSLQHRFEYDHARQRYLAGLFVAGCIDKYWPYDADRAKSTPGYYDDPEKNIEFTAYAASVRHSDTLCDGGKRPINVREAKKLEWITGFEYFKWSIIKMAEYEGWRPDLSDRAMECCLRHPDEPTWLELENEKSIGYKDYLDKHPRNYLKIDPELEPKLIALIEAALIGWESDKEELMGYEEDLKCVDLGLTKITIDDVVHSYPKNLSIKTLFDEYSECKDKESKIELIFTYAGYIAYSKGYASLIFGCRCYCGDYSFWNINGVNGKDVYKKEFARRKKAHENPTKLNEWSNLVFDLVNGEEHIRAERPGHYEKLLQEFKSITGRDFIRGEDYFDMFQRLAIEDGWYIPDTNKAWFENPAPPEEEYGCAELPTRYQ